MRELRLRNLTYYNQLASIVDAILEVETTNFNVRMDERRKLHLINLFHGWVVGCTSERENQNNYTESKVADMLNDTVFDHINRAELDTDSVRDAFKSKFDYNP